MNKFRTLVLVLFTALAVSWSWNSNAQTRTSVANGLFYFPTTWDCMCVPSPHTGESIVINHAVTLNNAIGVYGGSLTVNGSGSLTQDATPRDMHVNNSGSVTVHGSLTVDRLWVQNGSFVNNGTSTIRTFANEMTLSNSGTVNVPDSMYNVGTLTNSPSGTINVSTFYNDNVMNNGGQVLNVDSMTNAGTMTNYALAVIEVDSATNTGTFDNSGHFDVWALTNTGTWDNYGLLDFVDMANLGVFNNHNSIVGTGRFGNFTDFNNLAGASMVVGISFINADQYPPQPNGTVAIFSNTGTVTVGDSWYNFAVIQGDAPGSFTVQDSTVNYGTLTGSFDLCDLTPTTGTPPIIDFNFGTVDPGITYCMLVSTAEPEQDGTFSIFPNPTQDQVAISLPSSVGQVCSIRVTDAVGRSVLNRTLTLSGNTVLQLPDLVAGFYTIRLETNGTAHTQRLSVN